ncbi:Retrovirus-related Pol polyprotein from transposon 17.6, partial [Mucuna pruriens]
MKVCRNFYDDFFIFGPSFDKCLCNLDLVLKRCRNTNLVLNWEKCQFMVQECIILGHKVFLKEIEVDLAKVEVIAKLLDKDIEFEFSNACLKAFELLKEKFTSALVDTKPHLIKWVLLLQEFDLEIKIKRDRELSGRPLVLPRPEGYATCK